MLVRILKSVFCTICTFWFLSIFFSNFKTKQRLLKYCFYTPLLTLNIRFIYNDSGGLACFHFGSYFQHLCTFFSVWTIWNKFIYTANRKQRLFFVTYVYTMSETKCVVLTYNENIWLNKTPSAWRSNYKLHQIWVVDW